jgi:DNA-binding transcriptional regulator LsrR (DeoR family)
MMQDDTIKSALGLAKNADVILTSVGSIEYKSWEHYLGESTFEILSKQGAIGHIGGHFFDINGKQVSSKLEERMVGIAYDDFKRCKNVVCIAYGQMKAKAVMGVLRGEFVDTLIIDQECAEAVMKLL